MKRYRFQIHTLTCLGAFSGLASWGLTNTDSRPVWNETIPLFSVTYTLLGLGYWLIKEELNVCGMLPHLKAHSAIPEGSLCGMGKSGEWETQKGEDGRGTALASIPNLTSWFQGGVWDSACLLSSQDHILRSRDPGPRLPMLSTEKEYLPHLLNALRSLLLFFSDKRKFSWTRASFHG